MEWKNIFVVFLLIIQLAAVGFAGNGPAATNGNNGNADAQGQEMTVLPSLDEVSVVTDSSGTVLGIFEGSDWYDPCQVSEDCDSGTFFQLIYRVGSTPEKIVLKSPGGKEEQAREGLEIVGATVPLLRVADVGEATVSFPNQEQLVVKRAGKNGKFVLSAGGASVETKEEIFVESGTNNVYVSSGGKNYQLYLSPDEALKRAEGEGYETAGGAELRVIDGIPTYVVYAKKLDKFFFLTLGETEVVLYIDQTGKVVETSAGG